jgi:hypothetical protein
MSEATSPESLCFHQRLCTQTGKRCNPAKEQTCLCWWESINPDDFEILSLKYRSEKKDVPQ